MPTLSPSNVPAKGGILLPKINCHAWNADRSMIAVCPSNKQIHVYQVSGTDLSQWKCLHVLEEHDHIVTAIDWAPKTNRIISCSQDRNAYVWTFEQDKNEWKPTLVLLRINRAATCCKWSPNEDKFAVGSSSKLVCVCHYEQENNWWVGKMIKKPHKSTVLGIAWHPTNNTLLATSSSDFKARVFSAYIKNVDGKPAEKPPAFGEVIKEYSSKGWVHAVKYSPSGKYLAFSGHDSTLTIVDVASDEESVIRTPDLPYMDFIFLSDDAICAVGHSFYPVAICNKGGSWTYVGNCDMEGKKNEKAQTGVRSAFMKFQTEAAVGAHNAAKVNTGSQTRHTNAVTGIHVVKESGGKVSEFSTSSLDGTVLFWSVNDIAKKLEGFSL